MLLVVCGVVVALLALFIAVSGFMLHAAAKKAPENATVIVLGAGLQGDQPSRMLRDRLNAAARYLEANPEALTQYYSFFADLQASTETVSAAFEQYRLETEGYIRTGIVCYDGAVPQYGVAVGQNLTCREVDGETVVGQNDFRATFTASKLSFWQDASEVAYVSNNRLYITNITVLEGMSIGEWEISSENGLVIRWMGG